MEGPLNQLIHKLDMGGADVRVLRSSFLCVFQCWVFYTKAL